MRFLVMIGFWRKTYRFSRVEPADKVQGTGRCGEQWQALCCLNLKAGLGEIKEVAFLNSKRIYQKYTTCLGIEVIAPTFSSYKNKKK